MNMAIDLVKDDSKMETDETVQDQEQEMTAELLNACELDTSK